MRTPRALPVYPWGDNEKLEFGDGADYAIYFDGTDFLIDSGTHEMIVDLDTVGKCKIYGGTVGTDDLELYANSDSSLCSLKLEGNSDIQFDGPEAVGYYFRESGALFAKIGRRDSYITFDYTAASSMKLSYSALTTTANITGLEVDATTNLTMGANLGATGLKIAVKAANGAGESYGIDLSGVPDTETTFKLLNTADVVTATVGTDAPANWIKCAIGATAYYLAAWTVDGG